MLTTLRIKNLALVEDLIVDFRSGYNVITGETGAGKSVLIGALNLVLGERADRTFIRSGCESCTVEAVFEIIHLRAPLRQFLDNNGIEPCEDNQLVLKRTLTTAGTNRQFINGSPTSLQTLAIVGEWLVDIHGPHEHQSLIHPAQQLVILDSFGELQLLRDRFAEQVRRREALLADKSSLIVDEKTYQQQIDLLRFQANEIASAKLRPDEDQELEQEHRRASNAAKLQQLARTATVLISDEEGSLLAQAGTLGRTLKELRALDPAGVPLLELQAQVVSALKDLHNELCNYADRVDIDLERLQELEERLNLIQSLKRKYGGSLTNVIAFGQQALQRLQQLEQRETELARINAALTQLDGELERAGQELSEQRRKVIPKLCRAVAAQLTDLGFNQSRFDVELNTQSQISDFKSQIPLSGFDTIEFLFAPNVGEPPRPLRAIASSGEMARVMLALKTVLAAEDAVPVLVFDEVDANVGGETAQTVGAKLRQIARKHQVLCITHLAPVAAPADAHFLVTKQIKRGRTVSEIKVLERADRIHELARMLGEQSLAARQLAEALLEREEKVARQ
ncbi:MAG: DNA repair protein RecN [Verrucomicrobia bacterium]|nr:DNA repair protein RecN [Verrucomicrobiota bacterium]